MMKSKTIPTETVDLAYILTRNINTLLDEGMILTSVSAERKFITLKFRGCE